MALSLLVGLWVGGGMVAVGVSVAAWGDWVAVLRLGQPSGEGGRCWVCELGEVEGLDHLDGGSGCGWVCRLGRTEGAEGWTIGGGWD